MKKLMIVAAVAAMVGSVEATDLVYDFTATLTTTAGKEGKDIKTTHKVGVGKDYTGNWWYDDSVFVYNIKTGYKDFVIPGKTIEMALKPGSKQYPWKLNTKVVKSDDDKQVIALALGYVPYAPVKADKRKVTGTTKYDVQQEYRGKYVWCETFSFKYTDPADCYRDSGKVTIKAVIDTAAICIDDTPALTESNGDSYDFMFVFVNFFGSQSAEKATKVEGLFAFNSDDTVLGTDIGTPDGTNFGFLLAGQGKYDAKLFKLSKEDADHLGRDYFDGISSISGSIVGYLAAPNCEACCADAATAVAFECASDVLTQSYVAPTAAYGTWSMKFNKKKSFDWL